MKIMQFAFDSREPGNYLPYTYPRNSVVYTGTHDNVTAEGWRQSASAEDVAYACRYLRCAPEDLTEAMICACLSCVSDMAVIPLADWLHLDAEARINTPSTQGANWQWRLTQPLTPALSAHIAELTALYHRKGEELLSFPIFLRFILIAAAPCLPSSHRTAAGGAAVFAFFFKFHTTFFGVPALLLFMFYRFFVCFSWIFRFGVPNPVPIMFFALVVFLGNYAIIQVILVSVCGRSACAKGAFLIMELTYQSPLMPASYTALSADEMTFY